MNMTRPLLIGALLGVAFLLWNAWQREYGSAASVQPVPVSQTSTNDIPNISKLSTTSSPVAVTAVPTITPSERSVHVSTDVLDVVIDRMGGNIVYASLLEYPAHLGETEPFVLLNNRGYEYLAQSGLTGPLGPDTEQEQAVYQTEHAAYSLSSEQNKLTVELTWQNEQGLHITKTFTFYRGRYVIDVDYTITNRTATAWQGYLYNQLKQSEIPSPKRGLFNITTYAGGTLSTPEKHYEKLSYSKLQKSNLERYAQGGWVAFQQHYFLSAWIPNQETQNLFYSRMLQPNTYLLGVVSPEIRVAAGEELTVGSRLYVGPKLVEQLKQVAPHLELTVDYGWLWFISAALFWLLAKIHALVGNWGWAIIILTFLIKLAFYRLSASSYRSMAKLRDVQPRLLELRERYAGDRQRMSQAMMELYKKERINPLGGCLPILVQIPVFIALYWVLLESVQLRHAPFILWIKDLSQADPYFVLPILMGVSMFVQQKLSPAPPDPTQARIMQFLPVVFTMLFLTFPAGLVLYWLVNNVLSIAQQWWITRTIANEPKYKPLKGK